MFHSPDFSESAVMRITLEVFVGKEQAAATSHSIAIASFPPSGQKIKSSKANSAIAAQGGRFRRADRDFRLTVPETLRAGPMVEALDDWGENVAIT
jgi:hypothetical protein